MDGMGGEDLFSIRSLLVSAAWGLLASSLVMVIAWWLHPSMYGWLVIINSYVLGFMLFSAWRSSWIVNGWDRSLIRGCGFASMVVISFFLLQWLLGGRGWVGLLLYVVAYVSWRIYRGWDVLMWGVRQGEIAFYGSTAEERGMVKK